jgi:hypothetical protein
MKSTILTVVLALIVGAPAAAQSPDPLWMRNRISAVESRLEVLNDQETQARQAGSYIRSRLLSEYGFAATTPAEVTAAIARLADQKESVELNLVGLRARREAIAKAIASATSRPVGEAAADPTETALNAAAELSKSELAHTREMLTKSVTTELEVQRKETQFVEAVARLEEYRRQRTASAGGELAETLRHELVRLDIDLSEQEARRQYLSDRLVRLANAAQLAAQLDQYDVQFRDAQTEIQSLQRQLWDLRSQLAADNARRPQPTTKPAAEP